MPPRRFPFVRVDGDKVISAMTGAATLSHAERTLLLACDGARSARDLAQALAADHPDLFSTEERTFELLRDLRQRKLVAWTIEVPLMVGSDAELRRILGTVGDDELRARGLAMLDELDASRRAVAAAAGDPAALDQAIAALETTFTRITGSAANRQSGVMYAGRGLVYEDTRRDADVTVGPAVLDALDGPLSLLLQSARWLTYEMARAYRTAFLELHQTMAARHGSGAVTFGDFWLRAQRLLYGSKGRPFDGINAELHQRWARILPLSDGQRRVELTTDALRSHVDDAFDAPHPGWTEARHHSPDIMIAAEGLDQIARGNFLLVLGELRLAANTLETALFMAQHPDPASVVAASQDDRRGQPHLLFVRSKSWPRATARTSPGIVADEGYWIETGEDPAPLPREKAFRAADLSLTRTGDALFVTLPDGRVVELTEALAAPFSELVVGSAFKIVPSAGYTRRVTIDRLVVARETWRICPPPSRSVTPPTTSTSSPP
jgi:hypothetical protein